MATWYLENKEKQRIFEVALTLMEEVGFEKMSIRRICEEAEISIGTFYHYFESKHQILAYFYNSLEHKFRDEIMGSLVGLDIREQIIRFYTWFNNYIATFGLEFAEQFFSNRNPLLNTSVYNNEIVVLTDELIGNALQKGLILPEGRTVRSISIDFCVIIKGIIFEWCVRRGAFDIGTYTEDILRRLTPGILP